MLTASRYEQRGVSSSKTEVHAAIRSLEKGIFPGAFCKILPDILGGDPDFVNLQHNDGAGTKTALAYLRWKLTGDLGVWRGIIRDSMYMNIDDAACVGALGPFLVSLSIDRNKALIPGEVISILIEECQKTCDDLTAMGIKCIFAGGETADLGDVVRTITVNNTATARFHRDNVIDASNIRPGDFIVGFSSTGRAMWESERNSGIGSNGLTNARHDTLAPEYRLHTETYSPETSPDLIYCGDFTLDNVLPGDPTFSIASALLSPTRTYVKLVSQLIRVLGTGNIMAFIHCSGGGQTKIGKFGPKGIMYVKDNLFPVPPLFRMLQKVRKLPTRQMYESYNMGHRLEAVVPSLEIADRCIAIAKDTCWIDAKVIGKVVEYPDKPEGRRVAILPHEGGVETYEF